MAKEPIRLTEAEADRAAEVFTENRRFIESVAVRHAVTPDHVPDIVQTVGERICCGLGGFQADSNLTTWLFRVTVNAARDIHRSERRHLLAAEAMMMQPEPVEDPDDVAIRGERIEAVRAAVGQLRGRLAEVACNEIAGGSVLPYDGASRAARLRARRRLSELLSRDPRVAE